MARKNGIDRKPLDLHEPVQAHWIEVSADSCGGNVERMIRKFTKRVRNDGILQEAVQRTYYLQPSEARRRKSARARSAARRQCALAPK